ncbi:MAG: class IV adenylate cyclase [Anaerolineaceae bacterium]|nr:class IV adenylate cyclase [Anaerolineaceae bacterium]
MPDLETEVKFYLTKPEAFLERVVTCGAELSQARVFEKNLRLDLPDLSLTKAGRVLRLRQDSETHLTYKDPGEIVEGVLSRREIEFKADDFETARRFFEALGYEVFTAYEKYRQTYDLGALQITLDEMPFGTFTEIEGDSPVLIQAAADLLLLDWSKRINISYLALFDVLKRNLALTIKELSFENFTDMHIKPQDLGISPGDLEN